MKQIKTQYAKLEGVKNTTTTKEGKNTKIKTLKAF